MPDKKKCGWIIVIAITSILLAGVVAVLFAYPTLLSQPTAATPTTTPPTSTTATATTTLSTTSTTQPTPKVLIDVPYLHQLDYPTGCESVSAVMAMQYWGVDITVDDFIDNYLTCRPLRRENGELTGPGPETAFIGDPRTSYGYGCYVEPIGLACYKLLGDDFLVLNRSDRSLAELTERYIDHDIPVVIWATINMVEPYSSDKWIHELYGTTVEWIANEHCLVLVGYDDEHYYCNDPYGNNGVVAYPRALLEERYEQMGRRALVIRPAE